MIKHLLITAICFLGWNAIAQDSCFVSASFTYEIVDGNINFTNTSSGEPVDVEYSWYFEGAPAPGTSTEENPILSTAGLPEYMSVTFTVHNPSYSCTSSYLETITTGDCGITASFDYETIGDDVILTSTTSGVGIGASYDWFFNETGYTGESVTVPASDFFGDETICLIVSDSICVDTICDIVNFSIDSSECAVSASFTYTVSGGTLFLTNTSTGEPVDAMYDWYIDGLSSSDENPSFSTAGFEESELLCLTVYDSLWECHDSLCMTLYFDVDSSDCLLDANFTYTISGGTLFVTNTSTGEPVDAMYDWYIDGLSSSDENPSFSTAGFEESELLCLTVYDSLWECHDSLCMTLYFDADSTECELVADFSYEIVGDDVVFTSTSTGLVSEGWYDWYYNGTGASGETVTVPLADFDGEESICLTVSDSFCIDTVCYTFFFGEDSSGVDSVATLLENSKTTVSVYPNPAYDVLNIEIGNANGNNSIIIQNALGQFVRNEQSINANNLVTIDVSDLPSGLYIVTVIDPENANNLVQEKFIKK